MVGDEDKTGKNFILLNFNRVYKVKFNNRTSNSLKKLTDEFNRLPKFKEGTKSNRGEGFLDFEDDFKINFVMKHSWKSRDQTCKELEDMNFEKDISNKNIVTKIFRYEDYTKGKQDPQLTEADLFWIKPYDILLIRGGKKTCELISEKYLVKFTNAGFEQIKFTPEFLLWMCFKYESEGKLSDDLIFQKMDKSRTQGIGTNENDIIVREGQGRMIPIPTIYGLLNDQELFHVGGDFNFREEYTLNVKLAKDLSIFIYSEHELKGKSYDKKCSLSFPFILELIGVFEEWNAKDDDDDDKYPDDDFFNSSIDSFRTQVEYSIECLNKLKEKYNKLRSNGVADGP